MKKFLLSLAILCSLELVSCYKKIPEESQEPRAPVQKEEPQKEEALPDEAETKDLPFRPYANALTELKNHNLTDAKRWFAITISDFPRSEFAKMAKVMNLMILLSEELGNLRCLKFWNEKNESLKEVSEKNPLLEKALERDMVFFQERAEMLGIELIRAPLILKKEALVIEKFDFSISLQEEDNDDIDDTEFIESLKKATDYETITKGKDSFIEKQTLKNLFSFITEFFNVTLQKATINIIEAPIDYLQFLNALGTRLYYISMSMGENEGKKAEFIAESKRILRMAKDLSENDKYNSHRLKVLDLLDKIEKEEVE